MFTDQGTAFPAQQASRASAIETETKLCISNLEYGVSNEDIKVNIYFYLGFILFSRLIFQYQFACCVLTLIREVASFICY